MSETRMLPVDRVDRRPHGRGYWADAFLRLRHSRSGMAGLIVVCTLALLGILGPLLAPWDYRVQDLDGVMANDARPLPPLSPGHLLGTDRLGRDLFSRTLDGAQVSMTVALVAQVVVLFIGVPIGAIAGWRGGRTETYLMRFTDVIYAFPDLLFVILITSAIVYTPLFRLMDGLLMVFLAIGLISWVSMARLVRAQVLSIKHREYVEAARALGVPDRQIVLRHVLPNAIGPIIVGVSVGVPMAILAESTLSFLGLGVQTPRASWGSLIEVGIRNAESAPWLIIPPMVALAIALAGFTLLGDGLRDAFDPKTSRRR
ncbi:MAG TPA: ABC transporter permease [Candidatus Limnocylindria bacterium]